MPAKKRANLESVESLADENVYDESPDLEFQTEAKYMMQLMCVLNLERMAEQPQTWVKYMMAAGYYDVQARKVGHNQWWIRATHPRDYFFRKWRAFGMLQKVSSRLLLRLLHAQIQLTPHHGCIEAVLTLQRIICRRPPQDLLLPDSSCAPPRDGRW